MTLSTRILVTALLALGLHLVLGWAWTLGAGIVGGTLAVQQGGLVGALGGALDWALLVAYNYATAGAAMQIMTHTMGGILGNMPGIVIVAATIFVGALLGGVGGLVGSQLRRLAAAPC